MSSEEGQRKLAAILAADAAGYSRLMAEDDRATVAALKQARAVFRERIDAHGGRLVDTAGDSVLAEFRSDVEAVQCAVEVQEKLAEINAPIPEGRRMLFRIGVNTGDVIEEADGTLYGDGVNVAARLEGLAEPGSINISARVHDDVEGKVDVGFVDIGEHEVKNIARPVRAYRVVAAGEAMPAPAKSRARFLPWRTAAVATVVILAVVLWQTLGTQISDPESQQMITAGGVPTDDPVLAMPTGRSIAVLPFDNLGGDPEQDYFADGLTEDIITALSRFGEIRVIARNSTFQYQGQAIDVREVGTALGADYVLEGSVRRADDALRVAAQLLEARNGTHIWSQQFDLDLTAGAVFAIQDTITVEVASAIGGYNGAIARQRVAEASGQRTEDLTAYDCILLVYVNYDRVLSEENFTQARECLEAAVDRDPTYVDALAALSYIYGDGFSMGIARDLEGVDPLARSFELALRAVEINPNSATAHRALAFAYFYRQELPDFREHADRALALNPNAAQTLGQLGSYFVLMGDRARGVELIQKAYALNPGLPDWFNLSLALERYLADDFEVALTYAEKVKDPYNPYGPLWRILFLSELGRLDETGSEFAHLESLLPGYSVATLRAENVYWNYPHDVSDRMAASLRKAGFPEVSPEAPSRPVIAVLPFDNLSGDPAQEYFADGITEDIITRLAQYPDILVLGRNTTFQFKGQAVDIPTIAEKLGADYVVEGSIRRGGDTVRVTAQLLGAEGGTHVWAETYDRALDPENLFAMQDEITGAIASTLGDLYGVISKAELQLLSRHQPGSLSSYECILRGHEYARNFNPENHLIYRECLERVVAEEPDFGEAIAFLSGVYLVEVVFDFNQTPDSSLARAPEFSQRGVAIAPTSGPARIQYARALLYNDQPERAVQEVREALRLAPNNIDVLSIATDVFQLAGAYEQADEMFAKTTRLNPNYPAWQNWHPAKSHLSRGEYAEVEKLVQLTRMDWWYWTNAFLAAAQCGQGDLEQGRLSLEKALEANPDLADVYWPEMYFFNKGPDVRPMIDNLSAGLEACGWDVPPDPGREAFAVPQ
jgi:adenylate cyclase